MSLSNKTYAQPFAAVFLGVLIAGSIVFYPNISSLVKPQTALAAKFDGLSKNGNSSCASSFQESIAAMPDSMDMKGSCCSPMNFKMYQIQVEGLKKYGSVPEIPNDPYDIPASLAKSATSHYNDTLTPDQQKVYDYAMQNSKEHGPCCCKCWRWYMYGGLAKILIQKYHFTGAQIVDVWNLSDGCGG
jgi:hypothetical protein